MILPDVLSERPRIERNRFAFVRNLVGRAENDGGQVGGHPSRLDDSIVDQNDYRDPVGRKARDVCKKTI